MDKANTLYEIPEHIHKELHAMLGDAIKQVPSNAPPIGGATGSAKKRAEHFAANPGAQQKTIDTVISVSQKIDATHGTRIVPKLQESIEKGLYDAHP